MTWPFVKPASMDHASRGQGNAGTRDGGKPERKPLPYSHPRTTSGAKVDTDPGKGTNHGCCGTQGRH